MAIDLKLIALQCGFSVADPLDPKTLEFLPEVRDMCSADRCRSYNRSWSCPPACGELEFWKEKASSYSCGLVLQTIWEISDYIDGFEKAVYGEDKDRKFTEIPYLNVT